MKDKSIKMTQIKSCLVFLISLYATADFYAVEMQKQCEPNKHKITSTHPARASPADSCQYSVQIDGKSNTVIVNDKVMVSTQDTTVKRNNIRVKGEGNTITVIQDDNNTNCVTVIQNDTNSNVTVSQRGNNNIVKISQNQNNK